MSTSATKSVILTCKNCNFSDSYDILVFAHPTENPDLLRLIKEGSIQQVQCHQCQQVIDPQASILVYRPDAAFPLILSPHKNRTDFPDSEEIAELLKFLESPDPTIADSLIVIPRSLLADALSINKEPGSLGADTPEALPPEIARNYSLCALAMSNFKLTGDLMVLGTANEALERVLKDPTFDNLPKDFRLRIYLNFSSLLLTYYQSSTDIGWLNRGLEILKSAISQFDLKTEDYAALQGQLGFAYFSRYQYNHELSDLEGAIEFINAAIANSPDDGKTTVPLLVNLGICQHELFLFTHDQKDIDQSIQSHRRCLESGDAALRNTYLTNLSNSLRVRYSFLGNASDLKEAIAAAQQAVDITPETDPPYPRYLTNLALCFRERYELTHELEDLNKGILALRKAVQLTPATHQSFTLRLQNLADQLVDRYSRENNLPDLEEAIGLRREVVAHTPSGHANLPPYLIKLAGSLRLYGMQITNLDALDEAIKVYGQAASYLVNDLPRWLEPQDAICGCLQIQYAQTHTISFLDSAIKLKRQLLEAAADPLIWSHMAASLADLLFSHSLSAAQPDTLDESIQLVQQSLEKIPGDSAFRHSRLDTLAQGFVCRYARTNSVSDLADALAIYVDIVLEMPLTDPDREFYRQRVMSYWNLSVVRAGVAPTQEPEDSGDNSYATTPTLTCDICQHPILFNNWWFVDTAKRPDLVRILQNDGLSRVICPNCGGLFVLREVPPIMLYFPDLEPPVLYSPPPNKSIQDRDFVNNQARELVQFLRQGMGDKWQYNWVSTGMRMAERHALPMDGLVSPHFLENLDAFSRANTDLEQNPIPLAKQNLDQIIENGLWLINHPALPTGGQELMVNVLHMTAHKYHERYTLHKQRIDLDNTIRLYRQAIAISEVGGQFLALYLSDYADILRERYVLDLKLSDLDELIRMGQAAVAIQPENSSEREISLDNLVGDLLNRYGQTGEETDLNQAIEAARQNAQSVTEENADYAVYLNSLGIGLMTRYDLHQRSEDLDEALAVYRKAVAYTPENAPQLPIHLGNLGNGLLYQYRRTRDEQYLKEAIETYERALTYAPPGTEARTGCLMQMGNGYLERYYRTEQLADLTRAIEAFREVAAETDHSPIYMTHLINIGAALMLLYEATHEQSHLDEAIDFLERAVAKAPEQAPGKPHLYSNLGHALGERYELSGALTDLKTSIHYTEQGMKQSTDDFAKRIPALMRLSRQYSERFAQTEHEPDLNLAVDVAEQVLNGVPANDPEWPTYSAFVASSLLGRFQARGTMADLEEALRYAQQAVDTLTDRSSNRVASFVTLGSCFYTRSEFTDDRDDLEQARRFYQQALDEGPDDSPDKGSICLNLSNVYARILGRTNDPEDLNKTIEFGEQAVASLEADMDSYALALNTLGADFQLRYDRTRNPDDLDQAIEAERRGAKSLSEKSRHKAVAFNALGNSLIERFLLANNPADQHDAFEAYEIACKEGLHSEAPNVLNAASNWGRWASRFGLWPEAVRAYEYGLEILDGLFEIQLLLADQEGWLKTAHLLHANAAYAFARAGRLSEAVEALERGRARQLTQTLIYSHANIQQLLDKSPKLHVRYQRAIADMRQLQARERQMRVESTIKVQGISFRLKVDYGELRDELASARAKLGELLTEIKQADQHISFKDQPSAQAIVAGIRPHQALVYVLTTTSGTLSILLYQDTENSTSTETPGITAVWADSLTSTDLNHLLIEREQGKIVGGYLVGQLGEYVSLMASDTQSDTGSYTAQVITSSPSQFQTTLTKCLDQIERTVIAPLEARLSTLDIQEATLIPCGLLGLLPLHAAVYAQSSARQSDPITIRFVPSASILEFSRQAAGKVSSAQRKLLAIGNPMPIKKAEPLLYAAYEAKKVSAYFQNHPSVLCETDAVRAKITPVLEEATYLHFACHGIFDADTPLASNLLLGNDEQLTLADILDELSFQSSRLVALSACQSGLADFNNVPDEVIGFPAAFLAAGIPGVISTLWSVNDISTALLMDRFYSYHLDQEHPLEPAQALAQAQLWLREVTAGELAQLFKAEKDKPDAVRLLPYELASEAWQSFVFDYDEKDSPYAHPFYWAAFIFTGY